jgi:hypothetical protein
MPLLDALEPPPPLLVLELELPAPASLPPALLLPALLPPLPPVAAVHDLASLSTFLFHTCFR